MCPDAYRKSCPEPLEPVHIAPVTGWLDNNCIPACQPTAISSIPAY